MYSAIIKMTSLIPFHIFIGKCSNGGFRCIGGKCIDDALICNGNPDCPAQDDETEAICGMITIYVVVVESIMF